MMRGSSPLRPRRVHAVSPLLLAVTTLAGCAAAPHPRDGDGSPATATVQVRNDSWEDLTIYLIRGSTSIPVGAVPGMGARRFRLEPSAIGTGSALSLSAVSRLNGRAIRSAVFDVTLGDRVEWVVRPNLLHSALVVR